MNLKRLNVSCILVVATLGIIISPVPGSAQTCGTWVEVVARSFFPKQVDQESLRSFATLSPQEYFQAVLQLEQKSLLDLAQVSPGQPQVAIPADAQRRLRLALAKFYDTGSDLYGVRLDADNFGIVPGLDVNALASGSRILVNEGTIAYFLNPSEYVAGILGWRNRTQAQDSWLIQNFGWKDDWNSIYFILAHEAAHNLMRHRDEKLLGSVRSMLQDYRQPILDLRADLANGRSGGGVKRHLWRSLQNFTGQFQNAEQQRKMETEADIVALVLLQRSGFDPNLGLTASQRMGLLLEGVQAQGWQAAMTKVLCSSHPDWLARTQQVQVNLNCLRFAGNLCQSHVTFPVETFLPELRQEMSRLDSYDEDTVRIAAGGSTATGAQFVVPIEVEPSGSEVQVDGLPVSPGRLSLSVGPHTVLATKDGHGRKEVRIVVFPDVQPKVRIKLERNR